MVATVTLSPSDLRRRYVPLGNRFCFPRTKSQSASTNALLTSRLHLSPNTEILGALAVHSGMEASGIGSGPLAPLANDCSISAAIMGTTDQTKPGYQSLAGSARAFRWDGQATGRLKAGSLLVSDPLGLYMPRLTPYKLRSYIVPADGAAGVVPYGTPLMGYTTTGGSLSGFGATALEIDQSDGKSTTTDLTQASSSPVGGFANSSNDVAFEPFLLGIPDTYVRCWAIFGHSIARGQNEYATTLTQPGAGDAFGNIGPWERACAINGDSYLNFAVPGGSLYQMAVDGAISHMLTIAGMCCDGAIIDGPSNDLSSKTPAQILTTIQKMVNMARAAGMRRVLVPTVWPRVNTVGPPFATDLASQTENTITPWPWATINSVNASLRAGAVTGCEVFDANALMRDPVQTDKWRVDIPVSWEGTHLTILGAQTVAAPAAAFMAGMRG